MDILLSYTRTLLPIYRTDIVNLTVPMQSQQGLIHESAFLR
jgi:hypothetical protein